MDAQLRGDTATSPAVIAARKGDFVVAGDPDLHDMYIAKCIAPGISAAVNPFLRVVAILQYPIQRAIIYPDVAHENVPIQPGDVCQLKVSRMATDEEVSRALAEGYEASLARALAVEMEDARRRVALAVQAPNDARLRVDPKELAILEAHERGEFSKTRRTVIRTERTYATVFKDSERGT